MNLKSNGVHCSSNVASLKHLLELTLQQTFLLELLLLGT